MLRRVGKEYVFEICAWGQTRTLWLTPENEQNRLQCSFKVAFIMSLFAQLFRLQLFVHGQPKKV